MAHLIKRVISTALIGTGFAVIMAAIAYQLRYSIDALILGWLFGVLAMGAVVARDNYSSHHATTGGK